MVNHIFVLGVFAAVLGGSFALSDSEKKNIREDFQPIREECEKKFNVTKDEVITAVDSKDEDSIDPCFFTCIFKEIGIVDSEGMFDLKTTLERTQKYIKEDDEVKKIADLENACAKVNNETVSDGEKGCDRTKKLLACIDEEKGNYTIPLISAIM